VRALSHVGVSRKIRQQDAVLICRTRRETDQGMRRLIAALNAIWFVLSIGAPQLMHPCPEHSSGQVASASEHSEHSAHHSANHDTTKPPSHESGCCCPGPQCGSQAVLPVAAGEPLDVPVIASHVSSHGTAPARSHVAWLLPFATAPPAIRA
jgi:hypothetical protein